MKLMNRNIRPIWYALYSSDELVTVDEYGNTLLTGEHKVSYKEPVQVKASVSPASGQTQEEMFGTDIAYSKVMVIADKNCPIDEHTVLWIESEPQFDEDNNPIYDYVVAAVARSLNHTSYAIRKREVS